MDETNGLLPDDKLTIFCEVRYRSHFVYIVRVESFVLRNLKTCKGHNFIGYEVRRASTLFNLQFVNIVRRKIGTVIKMCILDMLVFGHMT